MPLNLIRRLIKGTPLTAVEHDGNLDELETAIDGKAATGDAAAAVSAHAAAADPHAGYLLESDPAVTNARTPTAHAGTHATAGGDPLTPADIGAATAAQGGLADSAVQPGALGTAAPLDVGTGPNQVVQLNGSSQLPAVDGSQLTNLPSADATDLTYNAASRLLSSSTGADVTLPLADATNAGLLAAADFTKLGGVATGANANVQSDWDAGSGDAQILNKPALGSAAAADTGDFAPANQGVTNGDNHDHDGGDGAQIAYSSLSGTPSLGTAAPLDVGTDANQVVQLNGSSQLPAVDGSLLTNLPGGGYDGTTALDISVNGAASTPPLELTGTWFTGGTTTTTKPALLIEPTGTTSTAWSTNGTGLGVNAPSGFAGNFLDAQINGDSFFRIYPQSQNRGTVFNTKTAFGGGFSFYVGGAFKGGINNLGLQLGAAGGITFGLSNESAVVAQTILDSPSANVLQQLNGASPQKFLPYNTWTSATNYERGKLEWLSDVFNVGTEKGSVGGTARDMALQTDGTTRLTIKADGAIIVASLPTSNPNVAGQLWNDSTTLKVSAG